MNQKRVSIQKILTVFVVLISMIAIMSCATAQTAEDRTSVNIKKVSGTALAVKRQKVVSIAAFTANGDAENLKRVIH